MTRPGIRTWVALLAIGAITIALVIMIRGSQPAPPPANVPSAPAPNSAVGARGRIEPENGVVVVAAPYVEGRPSIVRELLVREGDVVRAGQVLAVLDNKDTLEKAVRQREAELDVARKRLALLQAGNKAGDLEAQRMEIRRWESEYEVAIGDQQRYEKLHANRTVSATELEQQRLAAERARRMLDASRERLKSLEEVRKEEVDVRSAEIASAAAAVAQARSALDLMTVRAPQDGKVLQVHAQAGEETGMRGILELGNTDRMFVEAEVYETDINRVRVGQTASVSGDLLAAPLSGRVTWVGSQVSKSELLPTDTSSFADTRVIKVKIELEQGERVAGMIGGKVDVVIRP